MGKIVKMFKIKGFVFIQIVGDKNETKYADPA